MKTITKQLGTFKQAETFQSRLYGKYNHVRLIQWPLLSAAGTYIWQVK